MTAARGERCTCPAGSYNPGNVHEPGCPARDDYQRLRRVVVQVLLDAEAGGDVVAIRRAVGDVIDAIEGGVPTPDDPDPAWRRAYARQQEWMRIAKGAVADHVRIARAALAGGTPPQDPDYACGAAYCDDPACTTHNRQEDV